MSPTIVRRDGMPYLVVGGSGGPRIITGTLQVMLNCWLWDMPPEEAVAAPRFHHQWQPDVLRVEEPWSETAALDRLRGMGHTVEPYGDVGHIQVIRVDPDGLRAASDPRKGGAPNGY
jgi:gamma-glutamyltranspeptidase/glutathione hydrolase